MARQIAIDEDGNEAPLYALIDKLNRDADDPEFENHESIELSEWSVPHWSASRVLRAVDASRSAGAVVRYEVLGHTLTRTVFGLKMYGTAEQVVPLLQVLAETGGERK